MEQVTISLTSECMERMEQALKEMDFTLTEFLEQTFSKKSHTSKDTKEIAIVELFQGYDENYHGEPYDWGAPVGEELW